mmetsp:Transcript_40972/g.130186  ORF Transcript_40972/g.130186 Transcript_40972/m.130186 type:complete len:520 (+) Transcript_40972:53-1612(+)
MGPARWGDARAALPELPHLPLLRGPPGVLLPGRRDGDAVLHREHPVRPAHPGGHLRSLPGRHHLAVPARHHLQGARAHGLRDALLVAHVPRLLPGAPRLLLRGGAGRGFRREARQAEQGHVLQRDALHDVLRGLRGRAHGREPQLPARAPGVAGRGLGRRRPCAEVRLGPLGRRARRAERDLLRHRLPHLGGRGRLGLLHGLRHGGHALRLAPRQADGRGAAAGPRVEHRRHPREVPGHPVQVQRQGGRHLRPLADEGRRQEGAEPPAAGAQEPHAAQLPAAGDRAEGRAGHPEAAAVPRALPLDDRHRHDVHQPAGGVLPAPHAGGPPSPLALRLELRLHAEGAADLQPRRRDLPPAVPGLPRGLRSPGRLRALHLLGLGLRHRLFGHPRALLQHVCPADPEVHAAGAAGAVQRHGLYPAGALHGLADHCPQLHLLRLADGHLGGRLLELVHAGPERGRELPDLSDLRLLHAHRRGHALLLGDVLLRQLGLHRCLLQRLRPQPALAAAPALPRPGAGV